MLRKARTRSGYKGSEKISKNFKLLLPNEIKLNFDDILGHEQCKKDLSSILQFLETPEKYEQHGIIPYSKYMLWGESGVGKSSLATAVAKKADLPIFVAEPSFFCNTDELLEQIDILFAQVYEHLANKGNCMLLFKDIHNILNVEPEIFLPALEKLIGHLRELPQIVMFATFSISVETEIPKLLIDPPAFNKLIMLLPPEIKVRESLIRELLKHLPFNDDINIYRMALDTYQMTAGDIKIIIKNAMLLALQNGNNTLSYNDFSEAMAQSNFGYVRQKLSEKERLATARHEAGHVIAGYFSNPKNYQVSKVEISPRAFYLGITQETVNEEKQNFFRTDLEAHIIGILGGMASEEYYYGMNSAGVANDLGKATNLAISMFKSYGMSKEIGPIGLISAEREFPVFPKINEQADAMIQTFLKELYVKTQKIMEDHSKVLNELTQALLDNEVVYGEDIMAIIKKYE